MKPTDIARLRRGLARPSTIVNVARILRVATDPVQMIRRYVYSDGTYPWRVGVRTPTGTLALTLGHPHDVRTVNEIFCRADYGHDAPKVVVDIGANIGVASAYFASRHPDAVVHAWEPVPHNLELARANLAVFGDRVHLHERAVAPHAGTATFSVEPVGRYSGLTEFYEHAGLKTQEVSVECDGIADALAQVIAAHGRIDLLKIDTEGSERALVEAVPDDLLKVIGRIGYEDAGTVRTVRGHALVEERKHRRRSVDLVESAAGE